MTLGYPERRVLDVKEVLLRDMFFYTKEPS